jgi:hypothetical protein
MRFPPHLLTVDFETFWSADYTLKKLSMEEYVRGPEFLAFGAAVKYGDAPARWITAGGLPSFFAGVPWHEVALLCQNAPFDGLILAHHYGAVPALYVDTLAMSRMALPRQRHSLEKLAEWFGLASKFDMLHLTKGLRELPAHIEAQLAERACRDADLTRQVFSRLLPAIPHSELLMIDQTVRLFTQPRLTLDKPRARALLAKVLRAKRSALRRTGTTKEQLASTSIFSELITERFGIEVELKAGKKRKDGTHAMIPALAKTDAFMKSLVDHDNPDVQALAALRLSVKSTLEETRLYRLLAMHERGPLCVFLNFAGAHTMRWSGGDKMNWQNLTRGSELRRCVKAPPGYVLVVADLSQIEARLTLTLAEQWDILDQFENGDPYCAMAEVIFERPITKKDDPTERGVGKDIVLGCGFGLGGGKLRLRLRQGIRGAAVIKVDLETAKAWVDKYRARNPNVVGLWGQGETALQLLFARVENQPWGPMVIDRGYVRHAASGVSLDYTGLVREDGEWRMRNRAGKLMHNALGFPIRLYGGMMTENVVQWLARMILAEAMASMWNARVFDRWPLVMSTHDELVCLAPIADGAECLSVMIEHMIRRPTWLPKIPLAAEGGFDACYSK